MSGSPVLDPLNPSDRSLTAFWHNDPYTGINNASLLVVNKLTNAMSYIYLTEEEATLETYTIANLVNGDIYYVRYTQVQNSPDGQPLSSNTRQGIPCSVPESPQLVSIIVLNISAQSATATVTFGDDNGCPIEQLVFQLLDETDGLISSQIFPFSSPYPVANETRTFVLNGLTQNHTYVVSCQCINDAGYSNLSNSVEFVQSYAPAAVNVLNVVSGANANLNVTVQGTFNAFIAISKIYIECCVSPIPSVSPTWVTLGYIPVSQWPIDGIFNVNVASLLDYPGAGTLLNGTAYNIRAYAVNTQNEAGLTGNEDKSGVPALLPVLSNPALNVNVMSGTLTATWSTNGPSFSPELVRASFLGPNRQVLGVVTTSSTSASLTNQVLVYGQQYYVEIISTVTVPPSTASYWQDPVLPPNNQIPSAPVEASNLASTTPGAIDYQSISYITGVSGSGPNNGVIQFFWQQPNDGYSPITNYVAKLYDTYPNSGSSVIGTNETGINEYTTFIELTPNTQQYWVTLMAENDNGPGPISTYPLDQSGIFIVGSVAPVTNLIATQAGETNSNVLIDLSWDAPVQPGYTLNSFTVYSISPSGIKTVIGNVSYVSGTANYTFSTAVPLQPNTYTYGIVTNATTAPGLQSVTSTMQIVQITTSGIPVISNVSFGSDIGSGNGIVYFKIDKNSSNIITDGLMIFCPPSATAAGSPNPVNVNLNTLITSINASENMPYSASYPLSYPISAINTPYLISASNGTGTAYASANLQ